MNVAGSGQDDDEEKSEERGWFSVKTGLREREDGGDLLACFGLAKRSGCGFRDGFAGR